MIGIIGGTSLNNIEGFKKDSEMRIPTRYWGVVVVTVGRLAGCRVAIIPRHGKYHQDSPDEVNNLGHLVALKKMGVLDVIAVTAVGGLDSTYMPGNLVFIDQAVDRTHGRVNSIFPKSIVGHVARPAAVCPSIHGILVESARALRLPFKETGKIVVINGPSFSSIGESENHRKEGHHVVGMTLEPWAKLAIQLLMCRGVIGQIVDPDNPPDGKGAVNQAEISERIGLLNSLTCKLLHEAIPRIAEDRHTRVCTCANAMNGAILTHPDGISREARERFCYTLGVHEIRPEWFAAH